MANRYQISSQSAILASTILANIHVQSEKSIIVEMRVINISPQVGRNPRKIFTMFDSETKTISIYTSRHENSDEPAIKIRLSTSRLAPSISRQFPDAGLLTLAVCSSAETAFLAGNNPPDISSTYFFFHPRHPAEKVSKNRVVWLESFAQTEQDSVSGLRTTKCFVKIIERMVSGTFLNIDRVKKIEKEEVPDSVVDYVNGGIVFKVRQTFADILDRLPQPFSQVIQDSIYNKHYLCEQFVNRLKGKPSEFLWSMIQWSACFGDEDVMGMISVELASRVNNQIRNGIDAVSMELRVGA